MKTKFIKQVKQHLKTKYPKLLSLYKPSKFKAKWWASNSKRLDLCAAQIAYMLHQIDNPIKDKVCLELGSGWVLSHAVLFYLLGAKKVYASDYIPLADLSALKIAIKSSELHIIIDILAPFEDHEILRERLEKISSITRWTFESLEQLGIYYVAPVDLSQEKKFKNIDFICSLSVLEHIVTDDILPLLQNLSDTMSQQGSQFHFIHLEDHADLNDPFDFLHLSDYPQQMQLERGNRVRASEWIKAFSLHNQVKVIHAWKRQKPLPDHISEDIIYSDREDLRISHLGLLIQ